MTASKKTAALVLASLIIAAGFAVAQTDKSAQQQTAEVVSKLIKPPLAKDAAEQKILDVLENMRQDSNRRYLSISANDGRLLRQLTEAIGAKRAVEIGTSTGYSSIWIALGLRATGGKLFTYEIDDQRAQQARDNFTKAGVEKLITVIEGDAHELVSHYKEPIDLVFLDADKPGYIDYLNKLLPVLRPGGLVLAHNMQPPLPDPRFIEAITTNPDLDSSFLLMEGAGMSLTIKKR